MLYIWLLFTLVIIYFPLVYSGKPITIHCLWLWQTMLRQFPISHEKHPILQVKSFKAKLNMSLLKLKSECPVGYVVDARIHLSWIPCGYHKCQEDCLAHTNSVSLQTGSAGLLLNCLLLPPALPSDTGCHPQQDLTSSMLHGKSCKDYLSQFSSEQKIVLL